MAELRVTGLDDSVTPREVVEALAKQGACDPEQIRCVDIRAFPAGLGSIWAKCPFTAAREIVNCGRIKVGWVSARASTTDTSTPVLQVLGIRTCQGTMPEYGRPDRGLLQVQGAGASGGSVQRRGS